MIIDDIALGIAVVAAGASMVPAVIEAVRRVRGKRFSFYPAELDLKTASDQIRSAVGQRLEASTPQSVSGNQSVRIVLGKLPQNQREPLRNSVAQEDVRAAIAVLAAISAKGNDSAKNLVTAEDVETPCLDNLVLIGSVRRNSIARDILSDARVRDHIEWRFLSAPGSEGELGRWIIQVRGKVYQSPSYEQEIRYVRDPAGYDGGFTDYGLLAKVPNPYDPSATVLIVAGIRALGTDGIARFIEEHPDWLVQQMNEDYFAVVIEATRPDAKKDVVFAEVVEQVPVVPNH